MQTKNQVSFTKRTGRMLFLVLLLGYTIQGHAQFSMTVYNTTPTKADTIDHALFRVQYMATLVVDTLSPDKKPVTEEMMLEVGATSSVFHSYTKYLQDSVIGAAYANGASQEVIQQYLKQYKGGIVSYKVYKNYPSGKVTLLDKIGFSDLRCEEINETLPWELHAETETILGYTCHKATCRFKGRDYEAWYTPEVPRGDGPWKLHGLPGLILRAKDSRGHYSYECTGIEQNQSPQPILYRGKSAESVTRKQLHKIYERYHDDPVGYMSNTTPNLTVTITNEQGEKTANPRKIPYNPVELND